MNIELKSASILDAKLLFDWANDPITRESSFNENPIEWNSHCRWFENKIKDISSVIFIFYSQNVPIGVVRFESNEITIIGVTVAPDHRGKGISFVIIQMACEKFWETNNHDIFAYIKISNLKSVRAFEKAGFCFLKEDIYNNIPCLILIAKRNAN
jgi:RimJ/RimL family protein N-acetyltransferase